MRTETGPVIAWTYFLAGGQSLEAGIGIKVIMAFETNASRPPDKEKISDSETIILLPVLRTLERHKMASPFAGLK